MRPKTLYWHGTDHEVLTMTHQTLPPPARRTSQQIANDPLQATELLDQCRNAVDAREGEIKAFQFVDWALVEKQAAHLQNVSVDKRGPLFGLPVAVKDIFDTADMPTTYGSTIYAGHRPSVDAACVARLRAAGAIITVSYTHLRAHETADVIS